MINVREDHAVQHVYAAANVPRREVSYVSIKQKHLVAKRIFDIVFSLIVITCLLSWLLPICFILIKMDSKGPIFFKQKRNGYRGSMFQCLKLRTMVVNNLADIKQATADDVRITRIGRVLRVTNIDELPQFFNVLLGHMSIVGPRPHMNKDCEDFTKVVASYNLRHSVKPGITGMAQVKGFRGPTESLESVVMRYQWDIFYVRHINFFLDIRIIALTFKQSVQALMRKNVEENTELQIEPTRLKVQPQIARQREYRKKMVI